METDPIIKSYFATRSHDFDKASTLNKLIPVLTNERKINQNSSNKPEINTTNAHSESIRKVINADVNEETLKLNHELQTDISIESFASQDELKQFVTDSISTRKIEETQKNLWETLNKNAIDTAEQVNKQISQLKNESLNQENIEK